MRRLDVLPGAASERMIGALPMTRILTAADVAALLRVRAITKVFAFDADAATAARFAQHLGIEIVRTESIENAIAESDIVVTCTPSRSPILGSEHGHAGLFIAGVGADNPEKN